MSIVPVRSVQIIQLGIGGVGRALLEQVLVTRGRLVERRGLRLDYLGLADSTGYLVNKAGMDDTQLRQVLDAKSQGRSLTDLPGGQAATEGTGQALLTWLQHVGPANAVWVDATAAHGLESVLLQASELGYGLVLANKRPLVTSLDVFHTLLRNRRLRHEATVGAGLPVIYTIHYLLDAGDDITAVEGCLSGTMGYLCAQMELGTAFSLALARARSLRYTEPDPREDLGGVDVARKALILARVLGWKLELSQVEVESFYPPTWDSLTVAEFLEATKALDGQFVEAVAQARRRDSVLRYVAEVRDGHCRVGLRDVPTDTLMGGLKGTDNIVSIYSTRYPRPLVICGAGAGVEVTAAAVLEDIVEVALTAH